MRAATGKFVGATEKIYQLVKQWSSEVDREQANLALCEIALLAGCITSEEAIRGHLSEHQYIEALEWLQKNHLNVYLWAMGQRCIGHPATIWGITTPKPEYLPALAKIKDSKPQNLISKIRG